MHQGTYMKFWWGVVFNELGAVRSKTDYWTKTDFVQSTRRASRLVGHPRAAVDGDRVAAEAGETPERDADTLASRRDCTTEKGV